MNGLHSWVCSILCCVFWLLTAKYFFPNEYFTTGDEQKAKFDAGQRKTWKRTGFVDEESYQQNLCETCVTTEFVFVYYLKILCVYDCSLKIFILIFLFLHEKYWVCAVIMCVTNHCDDMKLSTSIINTNSQARNGVSAERVNIFLARISSWRECMLFALQICKCFWIGKLNFYADGDSQRKMNLWFSWCL